MQFRRRKRKPPTPRRPVMLRLRPNDGRDLSCKDRLREAIAEKRMALRGRST